MKLSFCLEENKIYIKDFHFSCLFIIPVCFVHHRASDTKPTRVVRKRTAPEDFLGKGPNKKILMGK